MIKTLFSLFLVLAVLTANAYAQTDDFGLEAVSVQSISTSEEQTQAPVQEEEIIEEKIDVSLKEENDDNNIAPEERNVEENNDSTIHEENTKQKPEEEISYYIQRLNLSVEQQDKVKYITDENLAKKEQLLRSLNVIRQQARVLEDQSLTQFEALLTPEQKDQFRKLKKAHEAQKNTSSAEQTIHEE